jgi:nicotinamidase-related amidase
MKLDPHKTALLVIDMQKDFYAPGGNAGQRGKPLTQMQVLPPKINTFADKLRAQGAKVVFTKFIYDPARTPANYTEISGLTKSRDIAVLLPRHQAGC